MSGFAVHFQPEAIVQLQILEDYIAEQASPAIAARYVDAIIEKCNDLADFPYRGTMHDDIRPGLRTLSYRERAIIAFTVGDKRVDVLGAYYGGQDWTGDLRL